MESVQPGDVFAIPDFRETCESLEISRPALPKEASFFALRNSFDEGPFEVPQDPAHNVGFFKLPPGLEGQNENDAGVVGVERSPPQAENDPSVSKGAHDDEDLWLAESTLIARPPQYQTWDGFNAPDSRIQAPLFITEQGPGVFDALLESQGQTSSASGSSLVTTREYCACLLALALGRGSILFSWDSVKKSFVSELDTPRVTGCSAETIQGLQEMCLACGNYTRFLKMSAEKMHTTHASPSKVAVADLVDQLLLVIQSELGARGQEVVSLLQLQAAVRPVFSILGHFRSLVRKLSKMRSDEEIISLLFEQSQVTEHRDSFLRDATQEMLQSISRPWLDFAAEWTGLKAESGTRMSKTGPSKSFVKVANKSWIDDAGFDLEEPDYIFDESNMPSFIPADIAQLMFQTGQNLRFLWEYHPDHPLSDISTVDAASPPLLQWQFDWTAISRVEHKALAYEAALKKAIRERSLTGHQSRTTDQAAASAIGPFQIFGRGEDEIQQFVLTSMEEFDKDPPHTRDDKFGQLLRHRLFRGSQLVSTRPAAALATFNPHRSLIPLLSFGPIISCQSRVVNQECLRVLFNAHNLRQHLSVQKDFQLLGNGVFCSRISHALFDPEMDTAEREAGVALTGGAMGLRLSGRQTWPPASSELRLALMGVLSETYQGRQAASKNAPLKHAELPGDMSFAVRNLSNEEMEACMDPHSLEAMDFLRLSYKPPSTLLPIITPVILVKYDKIFKLLLRVLRMLYVANQLFRDMSTLAASGTHELDDTSLRFRIEAHHFVSCITTYFFDTGIAKPWSRFQTWLDSIELALRDEDAAVAADCGPDTLREHHERTLDQIMQTLLLRKRQQPVLELLEDIFRLILQFSQRHGSLTHGELQGTAPQGQGIEELYASFRKKVGVFLTVCRGLSEKRNATAKGHHKRDPEDRAGEDDADANTIDRLVLLLDMTDYHLRRRPA